MPRSPVLRGAALAVLAGWLAGCSGGSSAPSTTPEATVGGVGVLITSAPFVPTTSTGSSGSAATTVRPGTVGSWHADTEGCADPAAAVAPITGSLRIASIMPLSGGVAAAAYAPVAAGLRAAIDRANATNALGSLRLQLTIDDDQYDGTRTPVVVDRLLSGGVQAFTAIAGTTGNLAVRTKLNQQCVPQLNVLSVAPDWADAAGSPWTTGLLVPADLETKAYVQHLATEHPASGGSGGAKLAIVAVDNEIGQAYVDAAQQSGPAAGLTIAAVERIAVTDVTPPSATALRLAAAAPDAIIAAPLGPGCITLLDELAKVRAAIPTWRPQIYLTSTCATHQLLAAAGAAADGVISSNDLVDLPPTPLPGPEVQPTVPIDEQSTLPGATVPGPAGATTSLTLVPTTPPTTPAPTTVPATSPPTTAIAGLTPQGADAVAALQQAGVTDLAAGAVGWTAGEVTIETIRQAMQAPGGLTRASIIQAARHLDLQPSLARPGVSFTSEGTDRQVLASSLQLVRWSAANASFEDVGGVIDLG